MKITIVGLGLIGGSIAKALKGRHEILAMDMNEEVLLDAISSGTIKGKASFSDLRDSDVVYLCLYPDAVVDFALEHGRNFGKNTIVTDVCGIKTPVYAELSRAADENGFIYVGAHPMAGKESNSFSSSDAALFIGASYIMIKGVKDNEAARATLEGLAGEMGFGRIVYTTPEEHDRIIAFTSQVPHVLACAYVMSPQCEKHSGFSAGSYRDVSRVAKINEALWTDLFLSNRTALVDELDVLTDNIKKIRNAVAEGDDMQLRLLLALARETKERFG